jgi:phosphatidylinositol 3-kinase
VERSAKNPVLGNHFYWYIQVEREDKARGSMFEGVARKFERRMQEVRGTRASKLPLC